MSLYDAAPDGGGRTAAWTRGQAREVARSDDVVAPVVYPPETDPLSDDVHVWDTWILRDRDGSIATVDGYRVILSLTAPADVLPGKRHDLATIRYFYSRDGKQWRDGGPVFDADAAFGQRQWAGSALLDDDGAVYVYYTAAGHADAEALTYEQRIAVAAGGRVKTGDGLRIEGDWEHEVILEPDGNRYEREDQSRGMIYTFRDPWFFEDPATGRTHLLFEANTPVPEGSDACDGDPALQEFNGSIGIATSPTGDPTDWELRPPLLDAVCVNQELERPHVVVRDGRYYLFFSSHDHTFAPGIDGFDGLYGFVADSLRGDYRPLNDTGLVLTNPANAAFQTYSWMAFPHRDEVLVQSFFNYYDLGDLSLDDVGHLPEEEQLGKFGGTLAPTARLGVDGDRTWIRGTLDHGHVPTEAEDLPPLRRFGDERVATGRYGRRNPSGR
ncbi:glycoside hydrolase family 68 protein [Halostella sp. JP-L12]|uniref:glycoside hydrolase family 68 protein n=1 Tax=Halostella TaxID=1843185 RepID=UPI000EF8085F|nr:MULTISPECIES: glycoside hydrolase family 68 protein [Halostella]NHN46911.1 glycoside hydrolase family 68 protein [Halostella sp. JP-L12]